MCDFVHLHNHTVHSKLDGAIAAKLLFPHLKSLGMDSFAKTDHGTMSGTFEFLKEADKYGIKLIAGCEFYEVNTTREKFIGDADCRDPKGGKDQTPDERPDKGKQRYWHITMLAKNHEGYKQLVKLSSAANSKDAYFFKPRIDEDMLRSIVKPGGIMLGTGCAISRMSKTALTSDNIADLDKDLDYYHSIFGADNIFVEVMATGYDAQKEINEKLLDLAQKRGLRVVVTNDCHYMTKEHARLQDLLVCVSTGQYVDGERKFKFEGSDYYIKTDDQLREAFLKFQGVRVKDEWLKNSREIADQCEHCEYAIDKEFKLPVFDAAKDEAFSSFRRWANKNEKILVEQLGMSEEEFLDAIQ